ncbi:hypothetical protein A3A39_01610 [Candidatus Kaiserbacteria bacterium RIFCSPLOWO2_01_FULL_54_13]|uniref:Uncharacterized protein n=1 Tax=Candidatus Kaiserbacteria bacterium RIFCSPLOWO2_01_FULL_54_13 TaxID=1798512 RepID=A0A1F6F3X6_9BACT|nr:MAG: hypothetical protein A3A39_01610 [Candidatus Kaiserbacteria bacterium RIFCSPLOWO2_01_FULL_54_13]
MNGQEDSRLARVRAFKEARLAEEKQAREKYRAETIGRIVSAVYPHEDQTFFDKFSLWGRVYEYLGFKTLTRAWGDAYYERVGGETRKAEEFRREVESALQSIPEENAREIISGLLDNEEQEIARTKQKTSEG